MKTFKKFPQTQKCPICKTNTQKMAVLIGIDGTREGNNIKAQIFHLDCINLLFYSDKNLIAQLFK